MKSGVKYFWILPLLLISIAYVSAMACDLSVSMINQDPYPATPGDYVKVVFQVDGVANPECGKIYFDLAENYPLIFDPGQTGEIVVDSGNYNKDFNSYLIAPYKVRVDNNALDGENQIEVKYKYANNQAYQTATFNLSVKNNKANFEVYVNNYDAKTHQITFQVLNTGKDNIKALTLEIPKQDSIEVKGSNVNIAGDLDSNEYTTADFEAVPQKGDLKVILHYTDLLGERRTVEETVNYDPTYFQNRIADKKKTPVSTILLLLIIVGVIIYFIYKRIKKKRKQKERR